MRRAALRRALTIGAVCTAALAGCGGGDDGPTLNGEETKPPQQVVDDARAALVATSAVHVTGTLASSRGPSEVDLQLQGEDAAGTQTLGGVRIDLVITGGSAYVRAPTQLWRTKAPAALAERLADKWVRIPGELAKGIGTFSPRGLAERLDSRDAQLQPQVTRGEVDGQPAVVVTEQDGSQLFVANTGAPVPLRLVDPGPPPATLTFTGYGQVQPITAPPGAIGLPGLPSIPSSLPDVPLPTGIPTIPDDLPTVPDFPR